MTRYRIRFLLGAACLSAGLASSSAHALIVNISATSSGCAECSGGAAGTGTLQGAVVTLYNPVQVTLGPGTYVITNAATVSAVETGADPSFLAYNYQAGNPVGWAWSFLVATDNGNGTGTMLKFDYVPGNSGTQAGMAGLTGVQTFDYSTLLSGTSTAGFIDTITLSQTTTLDFFTDDYYLPDNAAGVALKIQAIPEPSTIAMLGSGVACVVAFGARRRLAMRLARNPL